MREPISHPLTQRFRTVANDVLSSNAWKVSQSKESRVASAVVAASYALYSQSNGFNPRALQYAVVSYIGGQAAVMLLSALQDWIVPYHGVPGKRFETELPHDMQKLAKAVVMLVAAVGATEAPREYIRDSLAIARLFHSEASYTGSPRSPSLPSDEERASDDSFPNVPRLTSPTSEIRYTR